MKPNKKLVSMATEWATELGKFHGYELLVAEYTVWGFGEVERGRNPDVVLKEVLAKIEENKDKLTCPSSQKIKAAKPVSPG